MYTRFFMNRLFFSGRTQAGVCATFVSTGLCCYALKDQRWYFADKQLFVERNQKSKRVYFEPSSLHWFRPFSKVLQDTSRTIFSRILYAEASDTSTGKIV